MGTLLFVLIVVAVVITLFRKGGSTESSPPEREVTVQYRAGAPRAQAAGGRETYAWQRPSTTEAVRESEACWVPPGRTVEVGGRTLPGGMVYVGPRMSALKGGGADPALVVPGAPVAQPSVRPSAAHLPYWPSYSEIDWNSRAAYLDWLASGRRDPSAEIGLVFLFFYGLERRLLLDAAHSEAARREVPALVREIRELLRVYGASGSFSGYASSLLDIVAARDSRGAVAEREAPTERIGWEIPFSVKSAVGACVAEGRPIPAEWAFSWALTSPDVPLRTAAERCPDEFRDLFIRRYRSQYGEGMVLKRNKTNLRLTHTPASATFSGPVTVDLDLPDATRLTGPVTRLRKLSDEVQADLDRFSRWVGRTDDRASPAALALLPLDLLRERMSADANGLMQWLDRTLDGRDMAVVPARDLLAHWPAKESGKLSKQEATALMEMLSSLGFGIEPDVRLGGANPSRVGQVVLFRGDGSVFTPTAAFTGASALLHLGAAVAAADSEVTMDEERHLEAHLEQGLRIADIERTRLRANLRFLLASPPSLPVLKKKLEMLNPADRQRVGRFLLTLAGADGHIGPAELKVLGKVYPLLGLDPDALFADVHDLAVVQDRGPVTVLPSDDVPADFAIPKAPRPAPQSEHGVDLDLDRIAKIRGETAEVATILGSIFSEEEASPKAEPVTDDGPEEIAPLTAEDGSGALAGLDAAHSALVRALTAQPVWTRQDFSALAERHGLMPAGAIEVINEAAFAACDEPMMEGEDPIEMNTYALQEMLA